jgi:hypothetical protein
MKKPNFCIEKFAESNVTTLEANELSLVLGASAQVGLCSNSDDYDSQCTDCSLSGDHDDQKATLDGAGD